METVAQFAHRMSRASVKKTWDVYRDFDWPEALDDAHWAMTPELISLYGTETWEAMDEPARKRLAFWEIANIFSFVLHGERPLLEGMSHRLYTGEKDLDVVGYLHHFLGEENKHMVMFAEYLKRYPGKIYPEKKLVLPKEWAPGEEDVAFYTKVLVVEELGDFYNVAIARDERVHPIVRQVNDFHHRDEARHIAFGRRYLAELWSQWAPKWDDATREGFQAWLAEYLRSSWRDFYSMAVYRDAGVADAYAVRKAALADPVCAAHRHRASARLVDFFLETGMLREEPTL